MYDQLLKELVMRLQILPGVGARGAKRMAHHLLQYEREGGKQMAQTLHQALEKIQHCDKCRNFTSEVRCQLCCQSQRNQNQLCIVASTVDVDALEDSGYAGQYFILLGLLSPMRGIDVNDIGMDQLFQRIEQEPIEELIFALPGHVEGEATVQYIISRCPTHLKLTRLAQGVPIGSELAYLDGGTLKEALNKRREVAADE